MVTVLMLPSLSRTFSTSVASRMRVVPVLVSADNYAYLLIDVPTMSAVAIDPLNVHIFPTET